MASEAVAILGEISESASADLEVLAQLFHAEPGAELTDPQLEAIEAVRNSVRETQRLIADAVRRLKA